MTRYIIHLTIDGVIEPVEEVGLPMGDFGEHLKRARKDKGLTLVELSQRSGVSAAHIARIEKGERSPGSCVVAKLQEALLASRR